MTPADHGGAHSPNGHKQPHASFGWLIGIILGVVLFGLIQTVQSVMTQATPPATEAFVENTGTATQTLAPVAPTIASATLEITPMVTEIQKATFTPTVALTATSTPNPVFIDPLDNATSRVFNSDDGDPEFERLVRQQAVNLSIPAPYEWQLYIVGDETRYADVRDYYRETLSEDGYKVTYDYQDAQDIYLFKMANGEERVAVQFWAKKPETSPAVMVLYFEAQPSE